MSDWAAKRFWKETSWGEADGGYQVLLDERAVKTPAKSAQHVPTRALVEAMVAEWDAQEDRVDPSVMPVTRMTNSAIDKVATQHGAVADMLAAYGGSDLLCYRATGPQELIARQAELWDPILNWAKSVLAAELVPVSGIMHAPQDPTSLKNLSDRVHALDDFQLAAFHDLVAISGSLVLGFAVALEHLTPDQAWALSRVDESWQEQQWGIDEEAAELAQAKYDSFALATWFFLASIDET